MRLGVYADLVYWEDGETISTDVPFGRFLAALGPHVDELVVFGRCHPHPGVRAYPLAGENVRFVPLPHYPNLWSLGAVFRSAARSRRVFTEQLATLDGVWLFGPHPLAVGFARQARRRGVSVYLGVRQDFPAYVAGRLPHRRSAWAVPAARILDHRFRHEAARAPTVALGDRLALTYGRHGWLGHTTSPVMSTGFSLVDPSDIVSAGWGANRSWDEVVVLSVTRLEPEKNPLLLVDILDGLKARHPGWRMKIAGEGRLAEMLAAHAEERQLTDAFELLGAVTNGAALNDLYRSAHAFLHVSLTEGIPQVLFEAQAAALPIVATDVGGVAGALEGGATGMLVPPNDAEAAVGALERLRTDAQLRQRLAEAGRQSVSRQTTDQQIAAILDFFSEHQRESRQPK